MIRGPEGGPTPEEMGIQPEIEENREYRNYEYTEDEEDKILELMHEAESDVVSSHYKLLRLIDLRNKNPEVFDKKYKPGFRWDRMEEQIESLREFEPGGTFPETFPAILSGIKELLPDEYEESFGKQNMITDKMWKPIKRRYRRGINPSIFMLGLRFDKAMALAADVKNVAPDRFQELEVGRNQLYELDRMIKEWDEDDKDSLDYKEAVRALNLLEKK